MIGHTLALSLSYCIVCFPFLVAASQFYTIHRMCCISSSHNCTLQTCPSILSLCNIMYFSSNISLLYLLCFPTYSALKQILLHINYRLPTNRCCLCKCPAGVASLPSVFTFVPQVHISVHTARHPQHL